MALHFNPSFIFILCREKASRDLQAAYQALRHKYQGIFSRAASSQENVWQLASAWYFVAYTTTQQQRSHLPFLSFPWLIAPWLCRIKENARWVCVGGGGGEP